MCLSIVKERYSPPLPDAIGYKVFSTWATPPGQMRGEYYSGEGKYLTDYRRFDPMPPGYEVSVEYKAVLGVKIRPAQPEISNKRYYDAGFHCFKTRFAAQRYARDTYGDGYRLQYYVRRVRAREVTALGVQNGLDVFVARYMTILPTAAPRVKPSAKKVDKRAPRK